ncbi:MAG: hypothetical protein HY318_14520 [Armatimonadetes bacterium]|nr:hypothetical protein [Armatimonadota bacterium]
MTARSVLLGLLLLPLNNYWIIYLELVRDGCFPTVLTLVFTAVTFTFLLVLLNQVLLRCCPRWAFSDGEVVTVYAMLAVGGALAGCDVVQTLVFVLTRAYWSATPENHWAELFHRYLPPWLVVRNQKAIQAFYLGKGLDHLQPHLTLWLLPALAWSVFLFFLLLSLFSLNALFRERWIREERLSFPVVRLPLALATQPQALLSSRLFWLGFAIVAAIDVIDGFNFLYPVVPRINVKQFVDLGVNFTSKPWNAVGWFPITLYPFVIGMGYLIPSDLCLSCVVFFWIWKLQRVAFTIMGQDLTDGLGGGRYTAQQLSGTWIALLVFSLYNSRRYLATALRGALGGKGVGVAGGMRGHRIAAIGVVVGAVGVVTFMCLAGMSLPLAAGYVVIYLGLALMISRIRAELGPPVHDLYGAGPDQLLTTFLGVKHIAPQSLTAMTLFFWLNRESYRSFPMAHHFEGMKLAEETRLHQGKFWGALMLAGMVGGFLVFPIVISRGYALGADSKLHGPARWFATEGYNRLAQWLEAPKPRQGGEFTAMGLAFTISLFLLRARTFYPWLPLHPSGFIVSSFWAIHLLWFPLLLAWMVKSLLQRYGGPKAYVRATPFFYGLILGEFTVGAAWQLYGMIAKKVTYAFWI